MHRVQSIGRRAWARLLGGAALGTAVPALAAAPDRKGTLVIGLDIADIVTLDPARTVNYSPPLTLAAAYDALVTMEPGHYEQVTPNLAAAWERLPDEPGWRFTLRPDARFSTGNLVTADDCRFSLDRLLAIGDDPAQFLASIARVAAPAPGVLDIVLRAPDLPLLDVLASANAVVLERAVVQAQGGTDLPNARQADMANDWLNQNSAGSGAYVLTRWARNQRIDLVANPHSWRGPPAYRSIVLRHMPDNVAQLRAIQRGDIDAAFNLLPDEIATLRADPQLRIESTTSLDFVYLALNGDAALNPALAIREARAAIGYAIDYDGLLERMLGSKAVRPASFLPIGVPGSTPAIARSIGFREDLNEARALLAAAGLPSGFAFELAYPDTAIAGITYTALARRLRTNLARVGIDMKLKAMNPTAHRTQYLAGKTQASLSFWNAPVVSNRFWADATLDRVARRVDFAPPADLARFVERASSEPDPAAQRQLWVDYQRAMVYRANLIVLFQPIYQVAVRKSVGVFPLTAAGWMAELRAARPTE